MYRVVLYRDAWKYVQGLDEEQRTRIWNKLKELQAWPVSHMDIKTMAGEFKGYHRFRCRSCARVAYSRMLGVRQG